MSALGRLLVVVFVDRGRIRIIGTRRATPFERQTIAASGKRILFVQGEDIVFGTLVKDTIRGWCGEADWDTQDVLQEYPRPVLVRAS